MEYGVGIYQIWKKAFLRFNQTLPRASFSKHLLQTFTGVVKQGPIPTADSAHVSALSLTHFPVFWGEFLGVFTFMLTFLWLSKLIVFFLVPVNDTCCWSSPRFLFSSLSFQHLLLLELFSSISSDPLLHALTRRWVPPVHQHSSNSQGIRC